MKCSDIEFLRKIYFASKPFATKLSRNQKICNALDPYHVSWNGTSIFISTIKVIILEILNSRCSELKGVKTLKQNSISTYRIHILSQRIFGHNKFYLIGYLIDSTNFTAIMSISVFKNDGGH